MGKNFQDYSSIQDFMESQPQNTELRQILVASLIYYQLIKCQLTI